MQASELLPDHIDEAEANGVVIRKGTVGAFLANARVLTDATSTDDARDIARRDIADALPALRALGLFDVLQIRDHDLRAWIDAH